VGPLQPQLTAEMISSFLAKVPKRFTTLYYIPESQDNNMDVSQMINETKAVRAKTTVMIYSRAELSSRILSEL